MRTRYMNNAVIKLHIMKITVERNGEGNIVETKELQIKFGGSVVIY